MKRSELPKELQEALLTYFREGSKSYRSKETTELLKLMPEWVPGSAEVKKWDLQRTLAFIADNNIRTSGQLLKANQPAYRSAGRDGFFEQLGLTRRTVHTLESVTAWMRQNRDFSLNSLRTKLPGAYSAAKRDNFSHLLPLVRERQRYTKEQVLTLVKQHAIKSKGNYKTSSLEHTAARVNMDGSIISD
jgi:hypothetical protein